MVRATLGDVPNPLGGGVATALKHFQRSDLQAGRSEHGDLELHLDRRTRPRLALVSSNERHLSSQRVLSLSREPSNAPHDGLSLGLVLRAACPDGQLAASRVGRRRDYNHHVGGEQVLAEVGDSLDIHRNRGLLSLLDNGDNPERKLDVLGDAVAGKAGVSENTATHGDRTLHSPHQLELSVWGHKRNCAVRVKRAQTHTAVEGTVFKLNRLRLAPAGAGAGTAVAIHQQLVVQAKLAFRHACQKSLHLDDACYVAAEQCAIL